MDVNCMGRFMDAVDYAVWTKLDFPVRKNIDSLQFGRDAAPIKEEAEAVPGLDELLQKGLSRVRSFSVGDKLENAQDILFRTTDEDNHPIRITVHHASP